MINAQNTEKKYLGIVQAPDAEEIRVSGIPFLKADLWNKFKEGDALVIDVRGIRADAVYLLGGINSPDRANLPWGGGKSFHNIFIGDEAGSVCFEYQSGKTQDIPLVFGYSIWWREPFQSDPEPFKSDPRARALLDRTLCVINGRDPVSEKDLKPCFLRIALSDVPLEKIIFRDNSEKEGRIAIEGITFENPSFRGALEQGRFKSLSGEQASSETLKYPGDHTIQSSDSFPLEKKEGIKKLAQMLYVYPEDINEETIARTKPDVTRENFPGPRIRFLGPPVATLFTHIYYENAQGMADRIEASGMVHESAEKADYYGGFGGYRAGLGAFRDSSYTRIRSLILLSEMGYLDKVEKSLAFFGDWIMYFPRSFPQVQIDGKPVPGHAVVIANKPHIYFDELKNAGWPTKFKTRDFGNPENDGHGMLMLSFYRQWLKQGGTRDWVKNRWDVIHEMAEYIPWALDHPELSLSGNGLLYNESEGGMQIQSLYCDMPCYLGLLGFAQMAESVGNSEKAGRWRHYAEKMAGAMEAYYPKTIEPWGDVWDPVKTGQWNGQHSVLAPILFGADFWGYDALEHLPEKWRERTIRTYAMQLGKNEPQWCCPAGLGYGQCYITESALLFDRMNDAEKMLEWLARFCFSPRQKHPYRVPEGITMAGDGSVWRRWGDLGNLYQLGEVIYTIRIMLGIDDINPQTLQLMPRIPRSWMGVLVEGQKVRTQTEGKSELVSINYKLEWDEKKNKATFTLDADKPLNKCNLRLGPFPGDHKMADITLNQDKRRAPLLSSGDSAWVWISFGDGKEKNFIIQAQSFQEEKKE